MSTLSVPLTPRLEEFINNQVKHGYAANKADVVRRALYKMEEDLAVMEVLQAELEPTLSGDLGDLLKKI